ncbi:MAG: glutamate synthase subunit beta [Lentisphaeria bacterium]|nr:glutamate synthase subunit beta [Lentisphaeria bacterium]
MGRTGGFLEFDRKDPGYRPKADRIKDFHAVEKSFSPVELHEQAARCMHCGIPFCHGTGCPLGNMIPEFNDLAYRGKWREALDILLSTSSFPEFTSRVCPALCEASCVLELSNGQPVAIRQIEKAIIEKGFERGYIQPNPPQERTGWSIAVSGSGPAGLAVADTLNKMGHTVTVFDEAQKPGGILRYGIPDFKLEKWVVDRRIKLMEAEGVLFEMGVTVGVDISHHYLEGRFGAICLTGGARTPRSLNIPGNGLNGVHFAMDYLICQNQLLCGETVPPEKNISAEGKSVVVIGGGDTGSDCVGTANRQGATSVTQLEIMPKPPEERTESMPWPEWPLKLKTTSSHEEGAWRLWQVSATEFGGDEVGNLASVHCVEIDASFDGGRPNFIPKKGTEFEMEAQLVLLAMGFVGPTANPMFDDLEIAWTPTGGIDTDDRHMTSASGVFSAGDMASGQSLVVHVMADARRAAFDIDAWLKRD